MVDIVLLADGTGNRAGVEQGTNVWRLYRALDLTTTKAFYTAGVGTNDFKPLKIVGQAFGFGLKANVIDLYCKLCQSYDRGRGDRVFMFGFSRGAYTVRLLASMIAYCGLAAPGNPAKVLKKAEEKYETFRRDRFRRFKVQPGNYDQHPDSVPVQFMGVWDTVDALGFPVDELADFWNYYVHPYRFIDNTPAPNIQVARHALAIDDERHTFHPVLWKQKAGLDMKQVWFPGMHSDVGGGYSDECMALVSLAWMIQEAQAVGLSFITSEALMIAAKANPCGEMHDSRAGAAAYYRYKPRDISALCDDADAGIPMIHRSTFQRIAEAGTGYAPLGIPDIYAIEPPVIPPGPTPESPRRAVKRFMRLDTAWDYVFWRRALYAAFLLGTVAVVIAPTGLDWVRGCLDCDTTLVRRVLSGIFGTVKAVTPDFAATWLEAFQQGPKSLATLLGILAVLGTFKGTLSFATRWHAFEAWGKVRDPNAVVTPRSPGLTHMLRTFFDAHVTDSKLWQPIWIIGLMLMLLVVADRGLFALREVSGEVCKNSPNTKQEFNVVEDQAGFDVKERCHASGLRLLKGNRYRITVNIKGATPDNDIKWTDGQSIKAGPNGFVNPDDENRLIQALPLRRSWSSPWFKMMGRIGNDNLSHFPIGSEREITANADGELFLFVNDAVLGIAPDLFYDNNHGQATLTVTRISTDK
jgi:hypothetical protein